MHASPGANTVYIEGGTYNLSTPISLTAADSNDSYLAMPGQTVVLSGGTNVSGWTVGSDGIWRAHVAAGSVTQFTVNGVAQVEARYPNYDSSNPTTGGWLWAGNLPAGDNPLTQMAYNKADFPSGQPVVGEKVNVFTQSGYSCDVLTIASVDTTNGVVTFTGTASGNIGSGSRYFISGNSALLDQPGEWWFDKASQTMSYRPPAGFTGAGAVASGGDHSIFSITGATNVTIQGMNFTDVATTASIADNATAAVYMTNSSGITVSGNTFTNVAKGVYLDDQTFNNTITQNNFSNIWSAAIDVTPTSYQNTITNNTIDKSGTVFREGGAIQLTETWGNLISNNLIQNVPRFGIEEQNYDPTLKSGGNTIQYNQIFNSGQQTFDEGAIYAFSSSDPAALGDIIRYNDIQNTGGLGTTATGFKSGQYLSWGVYLDDYTSNAQVYGNFVSGTSQGGVMLHGGNNNQVYDNILVNNSIFGIEVLEISKSMSGNSIYNNVIAIPADTGSPIVSLNPSFMPPSTVHNNIYVSPTGVSPIVANQTYAQWRSTGGDVGSTVVTSAGFTNASAGDYSFAPGSIALVDGIPQLPWSSMGPSGAVSPPPPPPPPPPLPPPVVTAPPASYAITGTALSTTLPASVQIAHQTYAGTNYTTTLVTGSWNSVALVQVAPSSWPTGTDQKLAYDNFVRVNLDLHTAGILPLNVLTIGEQGGSVTLGDGSDNFTWVAQYSGSISSGNTMVVNTGAGNDTIQITSAGLSALDDAHNTGNGSLWSPGYLGGSSVAEVHLGSGNDTVTVTGATKLHAFAGAGFAKITGGSSADTITGGTGGGDFTGGAGKDTFVFAPGDGNVTVEDFTHGTDILKFVGIQKSSVHSSLTTQSGISGILVTYDSSGHDIFLAHATTLSQWDMKVA